MRLLRWAGVVFAVGAFAPAAWAGQAWLLEDSCACGGQKVLVAQAYMGDGWWACYYRLGSQEWVQSIYNPWGACPG